MELETRDKKVLGSVLQVQLPVGHPKLITRCFEEAVRIERAYSRFLPNSELSKLNSNLVVWQDASPEYIQLLLRAKEFFEKSQGNFDVTVKEDLDRLGYDSSYSFKGKQGALQDLGAIRLEGECGFAVDVQAGQVALFKQIDYGGLGKGYALDQIAAIIEKSGVDHYCINAGGDIYAKCGKDCPPWEILLEHPDNPARAIGKIILDGRAIAASAPNRRKWANGLHHLINAKTREPATGVKGTFVLAKTGIEADAYSTAIFTAGFQWAVALCQSLPVEAMVISSENKVYHTPGFDAQLYSNP
jgi:thiamine biosynthesis lipoprotein